MSSVNEQNPILHFQPDRQFLWSNGWDFSIVNEVRSNNFGFINDVDYTTEHTPPLLALIGDSYVEALMVPFEDTVTGRLADHLGDAARVYSFGVSGASLSQYLVYADYVRQTFSPDSMVILVIGNDFDESLKKYRYAPGHHAFAENSTGELVLERMDYSPSVFTRLSRTSALGRYFAINMELPARLKRLPRILMKEDEDTHFVGNTSSKVDSVRFGDSRRAVDAFLDALPASSGLRPTQISFIVDGMRRQLYDDAALESAKGSYFDLMRRYFIGAGTERGYEVIDMQPVFRDHYAHHERRFEYPQDMHWNSLGHEKCFEVILQSDLLSRFPTQ